MTGVLTSCAFRLAHALLYLPLRNVDVKRKRIWLIGGVLVIVVLGVAGFFVYNGLRQSPDVVEKTSASEEITSAIAVANSGKDGVFDASSLSEFGTAMSSARMFAANGQFQNAINSYKRALELDDTSPDAWGELGNAYASIQQFDEARKAYDEAIRLATLEGDGPLADAYIQSKASIDVTQTEGEDDAVQTN